MVAQKCITVIVSEAPKPPTDCTLDTFTLPGDLIYETGEGRSAALDFYSREQGKDYKLIISRYASSIEDTGSSTKPSPRTYDEIVSGWLSGIELTREVCPSTGNYFWVTREATLEEKGITGISAETVIAAGALVGIALAMIKK